MARTKKHYLEDGKRLHFTRQTLRPRSCAFDEFDSKKARITGRKLIEESELEDIPEEEEPQDEYILEPEDYWMNVVPDEDELENPEGK